jgi:hypothetical protein
MFSLVVIALDAVPVDSNSSQQHQNENNNEDQTQAAARIVAPVAAMRPSWKGAKQKQYQND